MIIILCLILVLTVDAPFGSSDHGIAELNVIRNLERLISMICIHLTLQELIEPTSQPTLTILITLIYLNTV